MYEKDSLRTLYVNFHDPNYHSILQSSFFTNPSYRIPASITLGDITLDSVGVRYKGNSTFCMPNDNGVPKVPYNLDMNYCFQLLKSLLIKASSFSISLI